MGVRYDLDTGNPYQNLANAIVAQVCEDWRSVTRYLQQHKITPELEAAVQVRKEKRKEMVQQWIEDRKKAKFEKAVRKGDKAWEDMQITIPRKLEKTLLPYSKDELLLAKVQEKRDELKELEAWFFSPAYELLTDLDAEYLLRKLRKEAEENESVSG